MRIIPVLSAILLSAFMSSSCSEEKNRVPQTSGGGGGSGGGGSSSDAGLPEQDAGLVQIIGTLCDVSDVRNPFICPTTTALAGIKISVSGTSISTLSAADGSFSIAAPEQTSITLEVAFGEDGFRDILMPVALSSGGVAGVKVPAIPDSVWQSLLTTVGVLEPGETAGIAAYFIADSAPFDPVENADVFDVVSTIAPLYDGPNGPNDWLSGAQTGPNGAALILGISADESLTSFSVSGSLDAQVVDGVPIAADVLTVVVVSVE